MVVLLAVIMAGAMAVRRMPRDILPTLGVPTIYVAQPYGGMDPAQMEGFLTYYYEYHFLYINGLEHVESKSVQGTALIKLQFQPGTDMASAMAETVGYVNRARAFMPPGTVPPFVMRFDAGSLPVGNLVFASETKTVPELQDLAINRVRPLFSTLEGVSAPPPFGGSARAVVVRLNPDRLRSYGISPDEVVNAMAAANTISPSGNVRVGDMMPMVPVNSVVQKISDLEAVPIRPGAQPAVFMRDIGTVEDSSDITTGIALVNGRRTVYIPVTKRASASTLAVVDLVKANMANFQAVLPDDVRVSYEFDQSPYVTRSISGLTSEGLLGALLTGLMVLLFLRDFRSALIVVINIPLALFAALAGLWATGQTINIMTLGGLALAVGILVDNATVMLENIHTHLERGRPKARAVFDATLEAMGPCFLAMLCVVAVFIPSFFMSGAGRSLFVPLSLAVGFAMVMSFLLSTTLVPVLSVWLLKDRSSVAHEGGAFSRFETGYGRLLTRLVGARVILLVAYLLVSVAVIRVVGQRLGSEMFPTVDAGEFQLRLRAPSGTRIERTEVLTHEVLSTIDAEAGKGNVESTLGFIGIQPPSYPINTVYLWTSGPEEAVLQVKLKERAVPLESFKERLRAQFAHDMPSVRFSFEPSDILSRVMSFGADTPVEVAVSGGTLASSREYAEKIRTALGGISSLRDLQIKPALDYPVLQVHVDREKAGMLGVRTSDISRSLTTATSSSRFVTPIYWADPGSGVAYQIQVDLPPSRMGSMDEMLNLPVGPTGGRAIPLRSLATISEGTAVGEFARYNMQRTVTVTANVSGEYLGSVAKKVEKALREAGAPPARTAVNVRGQIVPMNEMLEGLQNGLLLTVIVLFLLLAANFESTRLSLIVVSSVPAVIGGVVLALWITRTTLNIQSFMGAVMAIGVAVANAILLVTFAERERRAGVSRVEAAVLGARSRLRPILMTSLAMLAGMLPMAAGWSEGGEQMAPLGRAVMGGLALATLATLLILPAVYALVAARTVHSSSLDPEDPASRRHDVSPDQIQVTR
jgi:multidrug efflux pump subunit AcrB